MISQLIIRPAKQSDFSQWLTLWNEYNRFYNRTIPDIVTQTTWQRFFAKDEPMHALVAENKKTLVGIAHYLYHLTTSSATPNCYLQDLFTAASVRKHGIGIKLIEAVYREAISHGANEIYWQTAEDNVVARSLYDKVSKYSGFVVYNKENPSQ